MRPNSREGVLGRQERRGRSTAALVLSVFPWQQRNTAPVQCTGTGEGRWPLAPSACSGTAPLQGPLSLPSPWLGWEGVGFKRLLLEDFFPQGKDKRDFEAGWGQRCNL